MYMLSGTLSLAIDRIDTSNMRDTSSLSQLHLVCDQLLKIIINHNISLKSVAAVQQSLLLTIAGKFEVRSTFSLLTTTILVVEFHKEFSNGLYSQRVSVYSKEGSNFYITTVTPQ